MAGMDTRPEAIASCIDFLEDELFEMGEDARMAEKALIRHPTCERYKTRLTEIYTLTQGIADTLDQLRARAPRPSNGLRPH